MWTSHATLDLLHELPFFSEFHNRKKYRDHQLNDDYLDHDFDDDYDFEGKRRKPILLPFNPLSHRKTNSSDAMRTLASSIWNNNVIRREILAHLDGEKYSFRFRFIDSQSFRDMLSFHCIELPPKRLTRPYEGYLAVSEDAIKRRTGGVCPPDRLELYRKAVVSIFLVVHPDVPLDAMFYNIRWKAYFNHYPNLQHINLQFTGDVEFFPENNIVLEIGLREEEDGSVWWQGIGDEMPLCDLAMTCCAVTNIHNNYRSFDFPSEEDQYFPNYRLTSLVYDASRDEGLLEKDGDGEYLLKYVKVLDYFKRADQSTQEVVDELSQLHLSMITLHWYEESMLEKFGSRMDWLIGLDLSYVPLEYVNTRRMLDDCQIWWPSLETIRFTMTLNISNDPNHFPQDFAGPPTKSDIDWESRYTFPVEGSWLSEIQLSHVPTTSPFDWSLVINLLSNWFGSKGFHNMDDPDFRVDMLGVSDCTCEGVHSDWHDDEPLVVWNQWDEYHRGRSC